MNKKQISLSKAVKEYKGLPILGAIKVRSGMAYISNLETNISFPAPEIPDGMYLKKFFEKGLLENTDLKPEDFVKQVEVKEDFTFTITKEQVAELITATKYAGNDDLRPVMTGVYIGSNGICCTDAHVLYHSEQLIIEKSVIVTVEAIKALQFLEGEITARFDAKNISFSDESGATVSARLIDGNYPNFKPVIPQQNHITATVNRKEILKALDILKDYKKKGSKYNKGANRLRLKFDQNTVELFAEDKDRALSKEMKIDGTSNEGITIGLDIKYLTMILKGLNTEKVEFSLKSGNTAVLINNKSLIMPMMLTD